MDQETIIKEFKEVNIEPKEIVHVRTRTKDNKPSYSYLIIMSNHTKVHNVKELKYIEEAIIMWEHYPNSKNYRHYHNCQHFSHGSSNCQCRLIPRCMKNNRDCTTAQWPGRKTNPSAATVKESTPKTKKLKIIKKNKQNTEAENWRQENNTDCNLKLLIEKNTSPDFVYDWICISNDTFTDKLKDRWNSLYLTTVLYIVTVEKRDG